MPLVEYEEAQTERERALAAIERVKYFKVLCQTCWNWADIAARHAENAGIEDAGYLIAEGRYPDCSTLEEWLQKMEVVS